MTRRRAAILVSLLLAVAAAGAWLLPPRIPAPPRWHAVDAGVRLWFRDEEMTPLERDDGGTDLSLRSLDAALWIESPQELSSAVFLWRGGSGSVSVRSWERWRPWARTPSAAALPPGPSPRLFLEWQNPRLVHRLDDGRLFYRMEIRRDKAGEEARLSYLGPRDLVERPLYDVAWDGCGAPDGVAAGESFLVLARYRNQSPYPWPDGGNVRVRLGYRWLDAEPAEATLRDLPAPVAPGETQEAWVRARGPEAPGRYVLELDLAYAPIAWFSEKGAATCRVEVTVTPPASGD